MLRKLLLLIYGLTMLILAAATIVEKVHGSSYVQQYWYGSWWFTLLWTILVALAVMWIVKRRMRRWSLVLLHASFVVILAGALLTRLTASKGVVHLRLHNTITTYMAKGSDGGENEYQLPFSIRLDRFHVTYHAGTGAAADYQSQLTIVDETGERQAVVSMNKILNYSSFRLYQSGYDEDERGTVLSVNADPYGIPVTYVGYALLFFSLVFMLVDPKGSFRRLLVVVLLLGVSLGKVNAQPTVPRDVAERFGQLHMLYDNRICPVQTYALDFTKKLSGKRQFNGLTPEQVLLGFVFWGDEWYRMPVLKVKGGEVKSHLGLEGMMAPADFFDKKGRGYLLGKYVDEYYNGNNDALHKQVAQIDEKLMMIMELRRGLSLKMFPNKNDGTWYSPTEEGQRSDERIVAEDFFVRLYRDALSANWQDFDRVTAEIAQQQRDCGGESLPSKWQDKAEGIYNSVPFTTILFMVNLTLGFLAFLLFLFPRFQFPKNLGFSVFKVLNVLSWLTLTVCMALRWIASGNVPVTNGYETTLLLAWLVMLIAIVCHKRVELTLFALLLSGFFLLVSHISQMDPKIGHIMPVLNSPLLTIHVSIIMMAYALLSMTFLCAVVGLCRDTKRIFTLSHLLLYPAITCLGLGIFLGAIWANISWGEYWSWDPKETWALISMMVYAVPLHGSTLPMMCRRRVYHIYMALAFLTILMTYFGVNYFLGGMHSYA